MISSFKWFIATLLLMTASNALTDSIDPAIVTLVLWFGSISYIALSKCYSWQMGKVRTTALVSLIVICLIIPIVETDLTRLSIRPIEQIKYLQ